MRLTIRGVIILVIGRFGFDSQVVGIQLLTKRALRHAQVLLLEGFAATQIRVELRGQKPVSAIPRNR